MLRLTALMLRQRLGDDPRIDALAARLADLPDEVRLQRIAEGSPDDLPG
jgi:hypothetical protein